MNPTVLVCNADCRTIAESGLKHELVFADPPFNIGHPYVGYNDDLSQDEYDKFTEEWVAACWESCDGVMALHGPDDLAEAYLGISRRLGMRRISWVNWHYRFGQCTRSNWIDARCHLLIFAKRKDYTWNPEDVLVESDRVKYKDKRVNQTERGGKRLPGTVWGIPSDGKYWGRVQGTSIERRDGHPNQLPEVYIERVVRAYSSQGDWVLDPFGGSGTTAVVCQALGRNCMTFDISKHNCDSILRRLQEGSVRIGVRNAH